MTTLYIIKDGTLKLSGPSVIRADGTIRIHGQPVALRAACEASGLDPQEVQKNAAPGECLGRLGMNPGGVEILTEAEWSARQKAIRDQAEGLLESQIPGLREMREVQSKATNDADRYHYQSEKMMSDENNDGVNPPRPEDMSLVAKLSELKTSNPRAALYLKAEKQAQGTTSYSATSGAMKGGSDAMEILRAGGSIETAEKALSFRYETDNWN
jgi:hypothetical protein